ncbi:SIP domain-containing protein [Streptomyces shenzhenensis]|uniref:SIP domain-containing protein n=1 Tax=Streptomyces shenzhenensis TaxID=943815 RepID=UPI003F540DE2
MLDALAADIRRDVTAPEGARIHWLPRDGAAPGRPTLDAVRESPLRPGRSYTWAAGESALATNVRRHLVRERQAVPRSNSGS